MMSNYRNSRREQVRLAAKRAARERARSEWLLTFRLGALKVGVRSEV